MPAEDVYELLAPAYEMLASPGRIQAEVDAIESSLRTVGAVRVLDAGCAVGFHSLELSRRGFRPTGIDLSRAMIREARARAEAEGRRVRFLRRDLQEAHRVPGAPFEAVLCLGNTMASVRTATARGRTFRAFRRALRPGGLLILQLRDPTAVRRGGIVFPLRHLSRGGREWILMRRQDPDGGRIRFTSTLLHRPRADAPWEMRVSESLGERIPPARWRAALAEAGFARVRLATDLRGTPRGRRAQPDLVVIARRI